MRRVLTTLFFCIKMNMTIIQEMFILLLSFLGMSKVPEQVYTEPVPIAVEEYKAEWRCLDCSPEENYILKEIQEHTKITDRNALATILGNIKQESNFRANICEGGDRVSYDRCYRGGYGIIQWTSENRYLGLGMFAKKYGCDPSTLECQTRYMINENVFQRYLPEFEGNGKSVSQYMRPAYRWLGWGIKGKREVYAYNYTKKFVFS